jgi:hypothetical protein
LARGLKVEKRPPTDYLPAEDFTFTLNALAAAILRRSPP